MEHSVWSDQLPISVLLLLTVLLSLLSLEAGFRLGRWQRAREGQAEAVPIVGSILALLAFMMAFTFGMAGSSYKARRGAVLDEANAIGTAYLRADLLPAPHRSEARELLREYVNIRLSVVRNPASLERAVERSVELHDALWSGGVAAANAQPSINYSLFLQSINQIIDLHAKRVIVSIHSRIPGVVWTGLCAVGLLSLLSVGYRSGVVGSRQAVTSVSLTLAFSTILLLTMALDRPEESMRIVSQQAMLDLQDSMKSDTP